MPIVPSYLIPLVTVSLALIGLGVAVWWRAKRSAGTILFGILAWSLALWMSSGWLMDGFSMPMSILVGPHLFYLTLSFGPALAYHLATFLERRSFSLRAAVPYVLSTILFLLFESAIFFLPAVFSSPLPGLLLVSVPTAFGLLFYIAMFYAISIKLYPFVHASTTTHLETRRSLYGLILLVIYLMAGALQFLRAGSPIGTLMVLLCIAFFIIASLGFIRVRFLDRAMEVFEPFFIVLLSGALVFLLSARDIIQTFFALIALVFIGIFGIAVMYSLQASARRRQELERINAELKTLHEAKSDFVAMVAHQLRTPLGGIRFAADMLAQGDYGELSPEAKKAVKLMKQTAERLLSLAETSLNAARFEVGAFQVSPTPIDIGAEIRMLLAEAELFAKPKGLTITAELKDLPLQVNFDREVLRNVVFNLVDNAIKYTEAGSVTVAAAVRQGRLFLHVSDTGTGLSADDKANLFQRFYRGESSRTHQLPGAGLGLYVTQKMVEAAQGKMIVESDGVSKGTTFEIEFPLEHVDEASTKQVT